MFGRLGDRIDRKPTLIIVLVLMTLATGNRTGAGLRQHRIAAPLILTGLRILQGIVCQRRIRRCGIADDRVRP